MTANEEVQEILGMLFGMTDKDAKKTVDDDIKSVTFNREKGKTTVILRDGRKGIASVAKGDVYDEKVGIALAYCYAMFGSKNKFNKKVELLKSNNRSVQKKADEE